ncbi:molybdenum cofactor guanylyltransferase [Bacillus sp. CECT 9360]|uniref:molybdenum cofactor guanylyltransferase n=1 Tax=Bacillus sp. CECT 9360 TaxID=2845821 RepID=UPI001E467C22|nr:molybdenum cofactor guanylyltransferase [Bacillus sp. CECT 9360]CAH0345014.1 putative molybdenum cofactor guanylyltransferase [Bacillus sp. CECT 9360]
MNTTGLLLAGGKSSRMGTNKAMLPISEEVSIQQIASELRKAVGEVYLITNSPADYTFLDFPMLEDEYEGLGPLAGLHAGMQASKTDTVFISACDMPFIRASLIEEMLDNLKNYEALVPEINGRLHPLFAVYRKSSIPLIVSCLEERKLRMLDFLEKINVKIMKETDFELYATHKKLFPYLFYNMNTPLEYEHAKSMEDEMALYFPK